MIVAIAALVGATGAYFLPLVLDLATAETTTRAQKHAEDVVDHEEKPFTATVTYPFRGAWGADFPYFWTIVLDRVLTADEQDHLTRIRNTRDKDESREFHREVWEFLRPLGARMIEFEPDGVSYHPNGGGVQELRLTLFSDRQAGLSITDMRAKVDSCAPSRAQTVVGNQTAGNSQVTGILWDLIQRDEAPTLMNPGQEGHGPPFFSRFQIDLGNGQSPSGLKVTSLVPEGQVCRWHIDAYFEDTQGAHPPVRVQDGDQPLVTEAEPARPLLRFTDGVDRAWHCEGEVRTGGCLRTKS
ncbi:hypothetical protein [Streptomyces sp. NRRL S-87]|uniref:hypothetical protein n=1 Tax=Streptomyces sp. NRRL S-87 TaxID=1463920 RepID=UPI0004BF00CD|nr:hypothetical protein [Streptomyces sp. NRRL S-87]